MKLQSKWLWAPLLATAIVLLPAADGMAQRGRDGGGDGRGACAPGAMRAIGGGRMRIGASAEPQVLAIRDLIALECLYRSQNQDAKIEPMYRDVLTKATDPRLRSVAYRRLARIAFRNGDAAAAETLLQQSLDEKLRR
jgi:hypothetical protein